MILRRPINISKRYGVGSWAFVTGSSDGIGKQIAIQLAQKGFNIVLVARNQQKLTNVEQELKKLVPSTQTKILVADFKNAQQPQFFDSIVNQVKELDISILVNNVGTDFFGKFEDVSEQNIKDIINLNIMPISNFTRLFIKQFLVRNKKHKTCIINTCSQAGKIPTAYYTIYSASKAYSIMLVKSLKAEYPQIDMLIINPSEVSTNLIGNRPTDILTIKPDQCARWSLFDLGLDLETDGFWTHKIQNSLANTVPFWLFNYIYRDIVCIGWLKERAQQNFPTSNNKDKQIVEEQKKLN